MDFESNMAGAEEVIGIRWRDGNGEQVKVGLVAESNYGKILGMNWWDRQISAKKEGTKQQL